jgi:hypothetical protein
VIGTIEHRQLRKPVIRYKSFVDSRSAILMLGPDVILGMNEIAA